jgi:hypothetical protein
MAAAGIVSAGILEVIGLRTRLAAARLVAVLLVVLAGMVLVLMAAAGSAEARPVCSFLSGMIASP